MFDQNKPEVTGLERSKTMLQPFQTYLEYKVNVRDIL